MGCRVRVGGDRAVQRAPLRNSAASASVVLGAADARNASKVYSSRTLSISWRRNRTMGADISSGDTEQP